MMEKNKLWNNLELRVQDWRKTEEIDEDKNINNKETCKESNEESNRKYLIVNKTWMSRKLKCWVMKGMSSLGFMCIPSSPTSLITLSLPGCKTPVGCWNRFQELSILCKDYAPQMICVAFIKTILRETQRKMCGLGSSIVIHDNGWLPAT